MVHPHFKAIENMNASSLLGIIEESKMIYVRENLSIFLHEKQIDLLKQVKKHEKPHHKRIRVRQFEKAKRMISLTCTWASIWKNTRSWRPKD